MAKQTGIFKIIGTLGGITFYEMGGEFYARKKSSLDGKRVKKDPRFRRTMEEAAGFGKASAAARAVYWALPEELRVHGLYGILTGRMRKLMRAGRTAQEAQLQLLRELCAEQGAAMQQGAPAGSKPEGFADRLLRQIFNGPGEASGEQEEIGLLLQAMGRRKCKVVAVAEKDGHRQNIFGAARAAG
jgi:hypothetical protein